MRVVLSIALVCACGKTEKSDQAPAPEAPNKQAPAKSLDGVKVTLAGAPVAMKHALFKKLEGGERYQIYLTDQDTSCQELMDNLFSSRKDAHTVLFNTAERLAPDGTLAQVVTDYFDHGGGEVAPGSKFARKDTTLTADFSAKGPSGALELHGSFAAQNCGEQAHDKSGEPKAKHASTATIEFAGHSLPLTGAVLFKDDVLLTTGAKTCDRWIPTAPVMIWRRGGYWHANGAWLAKEISVNGLPDPDTKDLKITRGATGTSDDGPTVQLTLAGKGTVEKYPFTIAGTIEAIDCKGDDGVIP